MVESGEGSSDDGPSSSESRTGSVQVVFELYEQALARAREGDMEQVDGILTEVTAALSRMSPLAPADARAMSEEHARLQQEIDVQAERIRQQLGAAGGGRRASTRYGALAPTEYPEEQG